MKMFFCSCLLRFIWSVKLDFKQQLRLLKQTHRCFTNDDIMINIYISFLKIKCKKKRFLLIYFFNTVELLGKKQNHFLMLLIYC